MLLYHRYCDGELGVKDGPAHSGPFFFFNKSPLSQKGFVKSFENLNVAKVGSLNKIIQLLMTLMLKTFWEKEKMLVTISFSLPQSVFLPFIVISFDFSTFSLLTSSALNLDTSTILLVLKSYKLSMI